MTSFDDELLADLADLGDSPALDIQEYDEPQAGAPHMGDDAASATMLALGHAGTTADTVAGFLHSQRVCTIMQRIEAYASSRSGVADEDGLVVDATGIQTQITTFQHALHTRLRDLYVKKFPELDALVTSPRDYARCVAVLVGRESETEYVGRVLKEVLESGPALVVAMAAATSTALKHVHFDPKDIEEIQRVCVLSDELVRARDSVMRFVESRMDRVAPNLTHLVGAPCAAQLVGAAGGVLALSRIPACNILRLGGGPKRMGESAMGMSATALAAYGQGRHTPGFVFYADMVQRQPVDERLRTARMLAAKCALAVRVDASGEARDGRIGKEIAVKLSTRIDRVQEPGQLGQVKALPVPIIESGKKRRGGRKNKALRDAQKQSELRQMQNRLRFADVTHGEEELDGLDETEGMGMISVSGSAVESGRVRLRGGLGDGKKAHLSAKTQRRLKMVSGGTTTGLGGATSHIHGLATSLAFTPHQGIELESVGGGGATGAAGGMKRKVEEANARWFGGGVASSAWKKARADATQQAL